MVKLADIRRKLLEVDAYDEELTALNKKRNESMNAFANELVEYLKEKKHLRKMVFSVADMYENFNLYADGNIRVKEFNDLVNAAHGFRNIVVKTIKRGNEYKEIILSFWVELYSFKIPKEINAKELKELVDDFGLKLDTSEIEQKLEQTQDYVTDAKKLLSKFSTVKIKSED